EWTNYEVAILVGGGIGVTPYASTLTDLVLETTSGRHHNVKCKKVRGFHGTFIAFLLDFLEPR
ncbi:hypothetical protein ANCCAN_29885, partial [Ancylostoma caninum]